MLELASLELPATETAEWRTCEHGRRLDREIPADLGLDRQPEGSHHDESHVLQQRRHAPAIHAVPRGRTAGAARLVAVEPYFRRQPQPGSGTHVWRFALYRRRQAHAAGFAETLRNLREISPTVYFNVPKGFDLLALQLRDDDALRKNFYRRLKACFFAGASLSQHTWDLLDAASLRERGTRVPMLSGLGATETGPSVTFTTPHMGRSGVVGLPAAGTVVKLAPVAEKLEIRVRGPAVTPGYWREPELTRQAFDEEGFYRLGDAVRPIDPEIREKV